MNIREDVDTTATPDQAWALIADPSLHSLWNTHIVATEASGTAGLGFRYRVTYKLSGPESQMDAEIVEWAPPMRFAARLVERNQGSGEHANRFMIESYTITPRRHGIRVRHDVVIEHSGVPLLLRWLIWFITRTGKPTGKPFMERFRELAEDDAPRAEQAR